MYETCNDIDRMSGQSIRKQLKQTIKSGDDCDVGKKKCTLMWNGEFSRVSTNFMENAVEKYAVNSDYLLISS